MSLNLSKNHAKSFGLGITPKFWSRHSVKGPFGLISMVLPKVTLDIVVNAKKGEVLQEVHVLNSSLNQTWKTS